MIYANYARQDHYRKVSSYKTKSLLWSQTSQKGFSFLKYLGEKQLLDFLSIETESSDICEEKYNNRYDS